MSFQRCPQCQKSTLAPTGAFWCCTDCGAAITSQALAAMRGTSNARGRNRQPILDHRPL
jgi:ribosomal protein L37AE/L43A